MTTATKQRSAKCLSRDFQSALMNLRMTESLYTAGQATMVEVLSCRKQYEHCADAMSNRLEQIAKVSA